MLTEKKAATISKIYFNEGGFGSLKKTFVEAKERRSEYIIQRR